MAVEELPQPQECVFCKAPCTDDDFCSGCEHYVCHECDINYNMPFGSHPVELHKVDPID